MSKHATAPCPHIITSAEGTSYCALAESSVLELKGKLQAAEKALDKISNHWGDAGEYRAMAEQALTQLREEV